jgi:hypothetical protein
MSYWQGTMDRQEEPDPLCPLCWQAHVGEPCPLEGRDCFVLYFGAYKRGKEPVSQREAQAFYRFIRGKLKGSQLPVLVLQLHQLGHWYVVVIWKHGDATSPLLKELGLTLWLSQTEIASAALPLDILREVRARFDHGELLGVLNVDDALPIGAATMKALAAFKSVPRSGTASPGAGLHLWQSEWVV